MSYDLVKLVVMSKTISSLNETNNDFSFMSNFRRQLFPLMFIYVLSSFQPVLHDWCNKGRGMCYPVCGMVHIKEPLLLIDKSSLCGGSGFPFYQNGP